jgi:DivIVA domain-containing protein
MNGDEVRDTWFLRGGSQTSGYDASEVDDLLRRVAAELDAGRLVGPLIENAAFRGRRRVRKTYDANAVDWFLDQLILRPGDAELAGSSAELWGELPVAQLSRSDPAAGDRKYRVKRKCFAMECENAWRDFGQQPGPCLRWGRGRARGWPPRYELRTVEQHTIASLDCRKLVTPPWHPWSGASLGERTFTVLETAKARSLPSGMGEIAGRSLRPFYPRSKWELRAFADVAGIPILYTGGRSFDRSAGAWISFPGQRWLRFLVRGTRHANAIMTAVDQAGNRVARFRWFTGEWGEVEITVHPNRDLTDELVLAMAISARWLGTYFDSSA